jgi:NAD(P)-dependent dehydrogenase (short-subunit alcohol dehydrogenase family)
MSRVAVITGASRGIGLALARMLAADGVDLCLCARSADAVRDAAESLPKTARVVAVGADVRSKAAVDAMFDRCRRDLGPVDWLVNNAAIVERTPLANATEESWDRVLDVNLKGPMLCAQAALPDLIARKGRIVNVSSISGTLGTPTQSAYNASKWGLNGLTKCWADELKEAGVFAAAVLPGSVDTEMLKGSGFSPAMQPEDIAKIIRFLLAEAPFAMTGSLVDSFG